MSDQNTSPVASTQPKGSLFDNFISSAADKLPKPFIPTDSITLKEEDKEIKDTSPVTKIVDALTEQKEVVKEAVIETATAKADTAKTEPITEEVEPEDFQFDDDTKGFINSIYGDESPVKSETTSTTKEDTKITDKKEPAVDLQEQYKPFVEKANEYDAILNNPMAKAFIEFVKGGGNDPGEFIKQAGIVDVESLSPEQLIEMDAKKLGLTPEEITEELESFNSLTPYEKRKRTNTLKQELVQQRDEKLKTFTTGNKEQEAFQKQAASAAVQKLDSTIQRLEGKKYEGLLITTEMANQIKQDVLNNSVPAYNEEGKFIGYDVEESIRRSIILNFDKQRSKALIELGRTMGADKALTARIRPNRKENTTTVVPTMQKGVKESLKEVTDDLWKQRGVNTKK